MARMLGYPDSASLLAVNVAELDVNPEDRQRWQAAMERDGVVRDFELQTRRRDGTILWLSNSGRVVRDASGRLLYYEGTLEDVTERRRAEASAQRLIREEAARQQAEVARDEMARLGEMIGLVQSCATVDELRAVVAKQLARLFEGEGDDGALYLFEPGQRVVEMATAWGRSPPMSDGFVPADCWAMRHGRPHIVERGSGALLCRHVQQDIPTYACLPLIAQGKALGFLHVCCTGARSVEERRPFLQTVAENLALGLANVKLREALRHEAIRDRLTGLYNRRYMDETLERELRVAARARRSVALVMIDIDHFKRLNDTFGHAVGDTVLQEVATSITARVRASDLACRFGGEEMVVILPDTVLDAATVVAEALRTGVRELHLTDGARPIGPVTISLGVAAYPQHGATPAALMRAADAALYQAKGQGRDRVAAANLRSAVVDERCGISGVAHRDGGQVEAGK